MLCLSLRRPLTAFLLLIRSSLTTFPHAWHFFLYCLGQFLLELTHLGSEIFDPALFMSLISGSGYGKDIDCSRRAGIGMIFAVPVEPLLKAQNVTKTPKTCAGDA